MKDYGVLKEKLTLENLIKKTIDGKLEKHFFSKDDITNALFKCWFTPKEYLSDDENELEYDEVIKFVDNLFSENINYYMTYAEFNDYINNIAEFKEENGVTNKLYERVNDNKLEF